MATATRTTTVAAGAPAPARQIATLGFPLLLGALSSSLSGIVDTAMMGRYGSADLAAVAGTSAVFDVFANVVLASVVGYQILAARFAGRDDPAGLRRALRASAVYCGGLAVLLTLPCLLAGGWLTGLVSGGDPQLRHIGTGYLAARAPTLLLVVPFTLITASLNAYRHTRNAAVAGIVINAVNLLLDWLLIYGVGPFPRLGAVGNGLATTVAWLVGLGCLLFAAHRFGLRGLLAARPAPGREPPPPDFETSIPRLAWPAVVSSGLDYASMAVFFGIVGAVGTAALAGGRIGFELTVLLFGVGSAFAAACRILIGRALGADDRALARGLWRTGRRMLLLAALVLAAVLAVAGRYVGLAFTSFPPVLDAAVRVMPLVAACIPLMAWSLGNVSLIRAHGLTRWDMYTNLAAAIGIQLPLAWLLAEVAGLGLVGAFAGVLGYWAARAVLTQFVARRLAA